MVILHTSSKVESKNCSLSSASKVTLLKSSELICYPSGPFPLSNIEQSMLLSARTFFLSAMTDSFNMTHRQEVIR